MKARSRGALALTSAVLLSCAVAGLSPVAHPTVETGRRPDPVLAPAQRDAGTNVDGVAGGVPLVEPEHDVPRPLRIRIPVVGIDSALDALHTNRAGELEAPSRWQVAGWFAGGTRPGAQGPAVIAGHVDSPTGPAVFSRLSELHPGDIIIVDQQGGTHVQFRVDTARVAAKRHFPTSAVYGSTPDPELRLITCDGPYVESEGGYQDNLIVSATEVTP